MPQRGAAVVLGVPGAPLARAGRWGAAGTKAGGAPDWLGGEPPPRALGTGRGEAAKSWGCGVCSACGAPRVLVLQAAAPTARAPERSLYVSACPKGCATSGAWAAMLAERRSASKCADAGAPQAAAPPARAVAAAATEDWGGASDDWGGGDGADDWGGSGGSDEWGGEGGATGGSGGDGKDDTLEDLAAAMEAAGLAQQHTQARGSQAHADGAECAQQPLAAASEEEQAEDAETVPHVPSFALVAQHEPEDDGSEAKAEAIHAAELLESYNASDEAAGSEDATAGCKGGSGGTNAGGASGDKESFAAEEYESASLDWGGAHSGKFLKFQRRLKRAPEQCARYFSPEGGTDETAMLAWPLKGAPLGRARACTRCGAGLVAECQLMPPLLYYLTTGLSEWHEDDEDASPPAGRVAASWEWLTAMVYTCGAGCAGLHAGANGVTFSAEVVEVVSESFQSVLHVPSEADAVG